MNVHNSYTSVSPRSIGGVESHLLTPRSRRSIPWKAISLVGIGLLGLAGIAHYTAPAKPVTLIVGLDASNSVRRSGPQGPLLGRTRLAIAETTSRLASGYDRLKLVRIDRKVHEFFDGEVPGGNETLLQLLYDHTQPPPRQSGTLPAPFWAFAAQQAASTELAPGAGVAVIFAGDADNDDLSADSRTQIRAAATRLAANPRVVSVEFYGFNPRNAQALREQFAPLGARLRLHPADAMNTQLVIERLETARVSQP